MMRPTSYIIPNPALSDGAISNINNLVAITISLLIRSWGLEGGVQVIAQAWDRWRREEVAGRAPGWGRRSQ
jgi:hypothetical protein